MESGNEEEKKEDDEELIAPTPILASGTISRALRFISVEPMLVFALLGTGAMIVTFQIFCLTVICKRMQKESNGSFVSSCENLTQYSDQGFNPAESKYTYPMSLTYKYICYGMACLYARHTYMRTGSYAFPCSSRAEIV
jgi:hypothetical protein